MDETSLIVWGMVFGSIGLGFFMYGKKQKAIIPFVTGVALFMVPYLITDVYVLVFSGLALILLPYFVRV